MTHKKDDKGFLIGHLNVVTPDHESPVTNFGKHDRVVAWLPDSHGLYCRVDLKWNLGIPDIEEILAVANEHGDIEGQDWKVVSISPEYGAGEYGAGENTSMDFQFHRV